MIGTLMYLWRSTPKNDRWVIFAAIGMPLLMMVYLAVPPGYLQVARLVYSGSILALVVLLCEQFDPRFEGASIAVQIVAWILLGLTITAQFAIPDPTPWRVIAFLLQCVMVGSWWGLAVQCKSQLSRSTAIAAAVIASAMLATAFLGNFVLDDPLRTAAQWGVTQDRAVVARTITALLEPVAGATLIGIVFLYWRRFLRRAGHIGG